MTTPLGHTDADVDRCVRDIAARMEPRLDQLTKNIQRYLEGEIPDLGQDALSIGLLGPSIASNVETLFYALRYGLDVQRVEAPPPRSSMQDDSRSTAFLCMR